MFLKIHYVLRLIQYFSIWGDAYTLIVQQKNGMANSGVYFAFKCKFLMEPTITFMFIYLISVLVIAQSTRIFEMPYLLATKPNATHGAYYENIWLTIMTITTVGYGDVTAKTILG